MMRSLTVAVLLLAGLLGGCAKQQPYDYTAFRESRPASILVLPPLNESPDLKGGEGLLSQVTYPLAESGYYVLPVALTTETFRHNGLTAAGDIHQVAPAKLREIFGADTALYLTIKEYGTSYLVLNSETVVSAEAKLVDLRSGRELWSGAARASSNEQRSNSSGNLVSMLVVALVNQIADTVSDKGYEIAGITSARLLSAGQPNGLLYGPYSPKYQQQ